MAVISYRYFVFGVYLLIPYIRYHSSLCLIVFLPLLVSRAHLRCVGIVANLWGGGPDFCHWRSAPLRLGHSPMSLPQRSLPRIETTYALLLSFCSPRLGFLAMLRYLSFHETRPVSHRSEISRHILHLCYYSHAWGFSFVGLL